MEPLKYKNISYIVQGGGWNTGIAVTNLTSNTSKVVMELVNKEGTTVDEVPIYLYPRGIKRFVIPKDGVFSATFYSVHAFDLFHVILLGSKVFSKASFPSSYHPPLTRNNSTKMVRMEDTYYMTIDKRINTLYYLPEMYATSFKEVCKGYFLEDPNFPPVPVLDFNTSDGSQPDTHPKGFHKYRNIDVDYTTRKKDWRFTKRFLTAYPEGTATIDYTFWDSYKEVMTFEEIKEYQGRIIKDTGVMTDSGKQRWHLDHYHLDPGGVKNWEFLNL